MNTGISEIVHIVPIVGTPGPALAGYRFVAASRVYLIAGPNNPTAATVAGNLKSRNIPASTVQIDNADGIHLLKAVAYLIRMEKRKGCRIYLNISGCGPVEAVYVSMAGFALGAEVYHLSDGADGTETVLPKVDIMLPDRTELQIMMKMHGAENYALSTTEIATVVYGEDDPLARPQEHEERRDRTRKLMNVSYLMKLMYNKGYVDMDKVGRKRMYSLTDQGFFMLILSGVDTGNPNL